jgi:gluconolactonase
MSAARVLATGLEFPEAPVPLADGSVLVTEIKRGTLSRVSAAGRVDVVARLGGGPNGAAIGPDGAVYVCNNGGFEWHELAGLTVPGEQPAGYEGGRIERVDLRTGAATVLYRACEGHLLRGPNDLVFDATGHFWFTDHGKLRRRERDRGGVYYAAPDGSMVREVIYPLDAPNGLGLSPDGTRLYVAETYTGRVFAWDLEAPGRIAGTNPLGPQGGTLVVGLPGFQLFDSLAVEAGGNVVVATLAAGALTVVAPDGAVVEQVPTGDPITTNVAFGGPERRTAFVTLSGTGQLVAMDWPRPGLRLAY